MCSSVWGVCVCACALQLHLWLLPRLLFWFLYSFDSPHSFSDHPLSHTHAHAHARAQPLLGVTPGFEMHSVPVSLNGIPLYLPRGKRKRTIPTRTPKLMHSLTACSRLLLPAFPSFLRAVFVPRICAVPRKCLGKANSKPLCQISITLGQKQSSPRTPPINFVSINEHSAHVLPHALPTPSSEYPPGVFALKQSLIFTAYMAAPGPRR